MQIDMEGSSVEFFLIGFTAGVICLLLVLLVMSRINDIGFTPKEQLQLIQVMEKVKNEK